MDLPTPVRVISDLHLGHPACRIERVSQLRPLFEGVGTVIFNGDTAELRSAKLRDRSRTQLDELKQILTDVGAKGVFLRGNHDPQISDLEYVIPNASTLVIHGDCLYHNISPWNGKLRALEPVFEEIRSTFPAEELENELDTWLAYIHQCRFQSYGDEDRPVLPLFKKVHSALRVIYPPRRPVEILRCWLGQSGKVRSFLENYTPERKAMIIGHTHRPGIYRGEDGEITGVNTGGFISFGKAWIADLEEGRLVVRKVVEPGGEMRVGDVVAEEDVSDQSRK